MSKTVQIEHQPFLTKDEVAQDKKLNPNSIYILFFRAEMFELLN